MPAISSYPSFDRFPTPSQASTTRLYKAADTGATYSLSTMPLKYVPYWPSSNNPTDYQPGSIGSNRNLQDTIHVRT